MTEPHSIPASEDDMVRSVRFKRENWNKLLDIGDQRDWSPNKAVNNLIAEYGNTPTTRTQFPPPSDDAGVSTYRATLEFQLPAMVWSDQQAYEVFFDFLAQLKSMAPNKQEAYGQIDAVRPMEYDARFADVSLPGSDKLHKAGFGPEAVNWEAEARDWERQDANEVEVETDHDAGAVKRPRRPMPPSPEVKDWAVNGPGEVEVDESVPDPIGPWDEPIEDPEFDHFE